MESQWLYDLHTAPTAPDQADSDGCEKEGNQFGNAAQALLADPARETIRVAQRDDAKRGENSEKRLTLSMFARSGRAKSHKNRDQPDRIDRDEDRNKRQEEFFDHGIIGRVFALPANSSTQSSLFRSTKPFRMKTLY